MKTKGLIDTNHINIDRGFIFINTLPKQPWNEPNNISIMSMNFIFVNKKIWIIGTMLDYVGANFSLIRCWISLKFTVKSTKNFRFLVILILI